MLLVNADDLGLAKHIDDGIFEVIAAHKVNSVSLVACGETFADAVTRLAQFPHVKCGVHLTLVGEKGLQGHVYARSFSDFIIKFYTGQIKRATIYKEMELQIQKVLAAGVPLQHADSHQHIHILPGLAEMVVELCQKYNIPRIRIINESPALSVRGVILIVMNFFSWSVRRLCRRAQITTINFLGFTTSMRLTKAMVQRAIFAARSQAVELMCHPGNNPTTIAENKYQEWGMDWDREKAVLLQEVIL